MEDLGKGDSIANPGAEGYTGFLRTERPCAVPSGSYPRKRPTLLTDSSEGAGGPRPAVGAEEDSVGVRLAGHLCLPAAKPSPLL